MTRKVLLPATLALLLGGVASQSIGQGMVVERALAQSSRQEGIVRVQLAI